MKTTDHAQKNKLELLGKLAAGLSHEIRNPLSALKLSLDYLNSLSIHEPANFRESVETGIEAVKRIELLVYSILDFSRKTPQEIEHFSLNDIVQKAIVILKPHARHCSVSLNCELSPVVPEINAKTNDVLHVIINLLANAIDASYKKGTVTVRTGSTEREDKQFVLLEVEDYGEGMNLQKQKKIFTDFFTDKKSGTGLGLSVCRILLENYTAELSFESYEGKGSIFRVHFPVPSVVEAKAAVHNEQITMNSRQ